MNSEIISLLSELLIKIDFPNGIYGCASGITKDDKDFLEEFNKNPNEEGLDRMAEIIKKRNYEIYKDFVMDRSTIMEQIWNYKRLINE